MATWQQRALAAAAILVAVMSPGAGCFKPTIQDGGLLCAGGADGGVCPEGFYCSANGTCRKGPKIACLSTSPHLERICTPDPGTDCDPICQSRCDCGRCTYNGTGLVCLAPGNKPRGAICTPGAQDDCAPGNFCRRDCEGKIGRCYRFCGNDGISRDDACGGQDCLIFLNDALNNPTDLAVCDPPFQDCNPVGDSGDCASSELGCYVSNTSSGGTICDCRGAGRPGEICGPYNSCIPGYRCVGVGLGDTTCVRTCRLGVAGDCPSGTCTSAGGGLYGYCPS
jgi:hypothetical protein